MNKNQLLQDFYDVSEICGDDLSIVCELVHFHHQPAERFSRVKSDILDYLEQDRLTRYAKTFDRILSLPSIYVKIFVEIKAGNIKKQVVKTTRPVLDVKKKECSTHNTPSLFGDF